MSKNDNYFERICDEAAGGIVTTRKALNTGLGIGGKPYGHVYVPKHERQQLWATMDMSEKLAAYEQVPMDKRIDWLGELAGMQGGLDDGQDGSRPTI